MLSLMTKFPNGMLVVDVDAASDAPVGAVGVVVVAVVDVKGGDCSSFGCCSCP